MPAPPRVMAGLRDEGILETTIDRHHRRRTLVSVTRSHRRRVAQRAAAEVDATLIAAVGEDRAAQVLTLLERLAELLALEPRGPIVAGLRFESEAGQPAPGE